MIGGGDARFCGPGETERGFAIRGYANNGAVLEDISLGVDQGLEIGSVACVKSFEEQHGVPMRDHTRYQDRYTDLRMFCHNGLHRSRECVFCAI